MAKDPSFPWYASDWLGSNKRAMMTLEQQGAYMNLLCRQWTDKTCSLPDDDEALAALSGMGEGWLKGGSRVVRDSFPPHPTLDGRIANARLLSLRQERDEWIEKSRLGGIKSGQSRRLRKAKGTTKGGSTTVPTKCQPNANSPSPSPSPKSTPLTPRGENGKPKRKNPTYSPDFERFWAVVPKHKQKAKGESYKRWVEALRKVDPPNGESPEDYLIRRMGEYAVSEEGRTVFANGPAPWLNKGRWADSDEAWQREKQQQEEESIYKPLSPPPEPEF